MISLVGDDLEFLAQCLIQVSIAAWWGKHILSYPYFNFGTDIGAVGS